MANFTQEDCHKGYRHPFLFGIHFLGGVGDTPRTLTDLAMSQFSAEIRRSFQWWKFYKEESKRKSWFNLGLKRTWDVRTPSSYAQVKLTQKQVDFVLDELEGYATQRDDSCQASCFDRIWESDSLLDSRGRDELKNTLSALRPSGTTAGDDVTVYLIDHMLYSLVYDKTLVSHLNGRVYRSIPAPPSTDIYTVSPHFMLLPSDVHVSADATSAKFISYINNLHPIEHLVTYAQLEHLLAGFVPLFERTLTDLHRNNPLVQRIPGRCHYTVWDEPEPPEYSDDDEGWVTYESEMREWSLNRPINLPDVPDTGYSGGLEKRRRSVSLRGRTVQIIVSASEITLHPQGAAFAGSPWHVEGMRSERIVACGFHCLSAENIVGHAIKFRMAVTYPRGFSAGDTGATLRTWGMRDGDSCHQYIGEILIREGLSVVFPNIYQHSLTPFTLADPTMTGHLTAIWFFLIDPEIKPVISTSVVGPQQKEWIGQALDDNLDTRLPNELIQQILDNVEGLMSQEEARDYKERFVQETDQFTQANNSYHFCIPFDIWNGPEIL